MVYCLYFVLFLHCLIFPVVTMETTHPEDTGHILRARAIVEECGCPASCLTRIRTCLITGACSACKIPTYGKRSLEKRSLFKKTSYK